VTKKYIYIRAQTHLLTIIQVELYSMFNNFFIVSIFVQGKQICWLLVVFYNLNNVPTSNIYIHLIIIMCICILYFYFLFFIFFWVACYFFLLTYIYILCIGCFVGEILCRRKAMLVAFHWENKNFKFGHYNNI